ncbi:MAG: CcmD family protein [Terrimonas sp.]|nr:CcmD family protein [Terrimonas sp.]
MKKNLLALVTGLLLSLSIFAQNNPEQVEMADTMRSNGKIYVVIAVILTILAGLILYVVRIDRKLGKLEKNQ